METTMSNDSDSRSLFDGLAGGVSILVVGPPGTGKSHFCGTVGEIVDPDRVALLSTKPREANSHLYRRHGIASRAELFYDPGWRPSLDRYEAEGFDRLIRRIDDLYTDDTVDIVIVDPYTDAVTLAQHHLLAKDSAATPREAADSLSYYGELSYKLKELTQSLTLLCYADTPKHVLVTVHAQPAKEEDVKGKTTADKRGRGVEYEGETLPSVEGGYRRVIAGEFDMVTYSKVEHITESKEGGGFERKPRYYLQARPSPNEHAKVALLDAFDVDEKLPNEFPPLLERIQGVG